MPPEHFSCSKNVYSDPRFFCSKNFYSDPRIPAIIGGMSIRILQPPHWTRPKGYSPGVLGSGRQVYVSGQFGCSRQLEFPDRLCDQIRMALENVVTVLAEADARPEHIVRLTWYIVDREEYFAQGREIGIGYREVIGAHYPAQSMVQAAALLDPRAKVEVEAIALLPDQ